MIKLNKDLDLTNLPKDSLKIFKLAFEAYQQGVIDTGKIMQESFESVILKTKKLYDEKIQEIDEILDK